MGVEKDGSALEGKLSYKIMVFSFTSKLDWGSYVIRVATEAVKVIEALKAVKRVFLWNWAIKAVKIVS